MRKIRQKVSVYVLLCGMVLGLSYWVSSMEIAVRTPLPVDAIGTPDLLTKPVTPPGMKQLARILRTFQSESKAMEIPAKFVNQVSKVPALIEVATETYKNTPSQKTKKLIIEGLSQSQDTRSTGVIQTLLKSESNFNLKLSLIEALKDRDETVAKTELLKALKSKDIAGAPHTNF